jgi:hypothetical protein
MAKSRPSVVTREWGATGVGKYFPPRLSPARRKRIAAELQSWDLSLQGLHLLVEDLAGAIGRYDSFRHIRETSRPAAVRENLNAALKAAMELNERLNALDGNSCLLIREAGHEDIQSLHRHLEPIVRALFAALQLAGQYPAKGNLPEDERERVAADVLNVLETRLGVSSGKLGEGCFEAVLTVVIEEALRRPRKDAQSIVSNLVDRVIRADQARSSDKKIRIEHPGGTVEYQRPQRR